MTELIIGTVAFAALLGLFYTWGHWVGYGKGYEAGRRDTNNEIAGRLRQSWPEVKKGNWR